jgi:predicted PurR-regulated permease PerM
MTTLAPVPTPVPSKRHQTVSHQLLSRIAWLLWVIVIALAVAFCFFASSICVTLLLAAFLAILVEPTIAFLERARIPRSVGAGLLILAGLFLFAFVSYSSYNRVMSVVDAIPDYADRIRQLISPITEKIEKVQESARSLTPQQPAKKVTEVKVRDTASWPSYVVRGVGPVWGAVIIIGVVPFMMFFCLIGKQKMYERLALSLGDKIDVDQFVRNVTRMVRGFALGNLVIGSAMALITVAVLWSLHLQGAVVLGILSGFLNLIPFLGVLLAAALPLGAALLQFDTAGPFVVISLTVIILHIISANLAIPKIIGGRVNIGPAVATAGILFWGWLWGPIGVLLAVPLTATVKLIADCHPSMLHVSNLLAESPRLVPPWIQSSTDTLYRAVPYLRKRSPASMKP